MAARFPQNIANDTSEEEQDENTAATTLREQRTRRPGKFETEKLLSEEEKYVAILKYLEEEMKHGVKTILQDDATMLVVVDYIFMHIKELLQIHEIQADMLRKVLQNENKSIVEGVASLFNKSRKTLFIYIPYRACFHRTAKIVQHLQDTSDKFKQALQDTLKDCPAREADRKFLVELMDIFFDKIPEYVMFLRNARKWAKTPTETAHITQAHDRILEIDQSLHVVDADQHEMRRIEKIGNRLIGFPLNVLPPLMYWEEHRRTLLDYGRLIKSGKLNVKLKKDNNLVQRYVFVFDQLILICDYQEAEAGDMTFTFVEAAPLEVLNSLMPRVEDGVGGPHGGDKGYDRTRSFYLKQDMTDTSYVRVTFDFYLFEAANQEERQEWTDAINQAYLRIWPYRFADDNHRFCQFTPKLPTLCKVCGKLIQGIFFPAYKCMTENPYWQNDEEKNGSLIVHKTCIPKVNKKCTQAKTPPRPYPLLDFREWFSGASEMEHFLKDDAKRIAKLVSRGIVGTFAVHRVKAKNRNVYIHYVFVLGEKPPAAAQQGEAAQGQGQQDGGAAGQQNGGATANAPGPSDAPEGEGGIGIDKYILKFEIRQNLRDSYYFQHLGDTKYVRYFMTIPEMISYYRRSVIHHMAEGNDRVWKELKLTEPFKEPIKSGPDTRPDFYDWVIPAIQPAILREIGVLTYR